MDVVVVLVGFLVFCLACTGVVYAIKPKHYWLWMGVFASAFIVGLIVLVGGGLVLYLAFRPDITQSVQPETVEQARKHDVSMIGIPLPDSAKNVQYAFFSQWIALLELVRFEAPEEDCRAVAEAIVAKYNVECPDRKIPGLRSINCVPEPDQPTVGRELLSAPWFTPQTIRTGLVAGACGGRQPMVWIDTQRGVLYYRRAD